MKKLFFAFIMLLLLGCSSQKNLPVTDTTSTRIVYQTIYQDRFDSVYIDRWHDVYIKGDTVFKTDSIINYRYKYLTNTDTLFKVDTCTIIKEVEKPVIVKQAKWWPVWILIILEVLAVAYYFIKKHNIIKWIGQK